MPAVPSDEFVELQPYLVLAERIGKMHAAIADGAVEAVQVDYSGELAGKEMKPATYALLKGLLQPFLEETVNFINARVVAESRGIRVVESQSTARHDYPALVAVTVKSADGEHLIAGTLFGRNEPRIVRIDGYRVDFPPEGRIMIAMHRDVPGTIGRVGTILGSSKINIAGMHVGRTEAGGRAVMALAVDSDIPPDVLKEMKTVAGMEDPRVVDLS
jgi:D-3-phosphoglycerate dehydrogenase